MIDLNHLTLQVKRNCNISDAKYWGGYTICGLLLRLRELYGFENEVKLWEDIEKKAILDWITEREKLWAELEAKDFIPLEIENTQYDTFDNESINAKLIPFGFFYGAGYAQQTKPSFFLAELSKKDLIEGYPVHITDKEYARDLAAYPAMLRDRKIIIRKNIILFLLWNKFNEIRSNRLKVPSVFAFNFYGISPDEMPSESLNIKFIKVAESEVESHIYHEIGEISEGERLGDEWKNLLLFISNTSAEFLARGIKDALADTSEKGMLRHLIDMQKAGSLGFYIASLRGYRKALLGEVSQAFDKFIETQEWCEIEKVRENCYKRIMPYAEIMLNLYKKETEKTSLVKHIEKEFSHLF